MAPEEWRRVTLRELVEIKHGLAFKGDYFRDEPPGDILLTPGNFDIGGGIKPDKLKYYDGPVPEEFVLNAGDLIVTMTDLSRGADTLGYPALVPDWRGVRFLHNQRLGKVEIRPGAPVLKDFLYFLLRTREYRHEVLAGATGTTVRHTSPERIQAFRFLLPPIEEQRAIAHALGTLDDKIELNRGMNETLEAIARAIFKSWFVDFDPVRAKVEGRQPVGMDSETAALFPSAFEDSSLGKIPKGWTVRNLPDVVELNPRRSLKPGLEALYVEMQNMPTTSARVLGWERRPFSSGTKFINGDVLLARITPCLENGKTAFVDFLDDGEVGWGSTEYIVLRSRPPLPLEYTYFLARTAGLRSHAISNMTGTSGRQRVPVDCFDYFPLAVPPAPLAQQFGRIVGPPMAAMKQHDSESNVLAELRDTLLPGLLSGKVRVKPTGAATAATT